MLFLVSIFGISYDYANAIDKKNSLINVDESSNAKIYNVAYTTDKYFIDMLEIIKDISYEDKNGQIRILKEILTYLKDQIGEENVGNIFTTLK